MAWFKLEDLPKTRLSFIHTPLTPSVFPTYSFGLSYTPISSHTLAHTHTRQISFGTCHACVTWPQQSNNNNANNANDDAAAADDYTDDDNFEYNHQFDSKLCGAADQYKESCGWGCKRMAQSSSSNNYNSKRYWSGFEKFFLCFWSFGGE
jgi:hypothetical protein